MDNLIEWHLVSRPADVRRITREIGCQGRLFTEPKCHGDVTWSMYLYWTASNRSSVSFRYFCKACAARLGCQHAVGAAVGRENMDGAT
jgi:hypothetical protein